MSLSATIRKRHKIFAAGGILHVSRRPPRDDRDRRNIPCVSGVLTGNVSGGAFFSRVFYMSFSHVTCFTPPRDKSRGHKKGKKGSDLPTQGVALFIIVFCRVLFVCMYTLSHILLPSLLPTLSFFLSASLPYHPLISLLYKPISCRIAYQTHP